MLDMSRCAGVVCVLATVLGGGCVAPNASSDDHAAGGDGAVDQIASFAWTGTGCVEVAAFLELDAERVRTFVPDKFVIPGEQSGRVALSIAAVLECADFTVDGESVGPGWVSDTGVPIEAPDGSDGNHYYHLWALTNVTAIAERAAGVGLAGGLVPDRAASVELAGAGPLRAGSASERIPWSEGPWALDIEVVGAAVAPLDVPTWWHLGERGLVRSAFDGQGVWGTHGTAEYRAEGEGRVHTLLGGEPVAGVGAFGDFPTLSATVELTDDA